MITLLFVLVISSQCSRSFDTIDEPLIYQLDKECIQSLSPAEITECDVRLEPVHDSTTWPSSECAKVERTVWNGGTQSDTYFK